TYIRLGAFLFTTMSCVHGSSSSLAISFKVWLSRKTQFSYPLRSSSHFRGANVSRLSIQYTRASSSSYSSANLPVNSLTYSVRKPIQWRYTIKGVLQSQASYDARLVPSATDKWTATRDDATI